MAGLLILQFGNNGKLWEFENNSLCDKKDCYVIITFISKIQLVVYYQCCVLIG